MFLRSHPEEVPVEPVLPDIRSVYSVSVYISILHHLQLLHSAVCYLCSVLMQYYLLLMYLLYQKPELHFHCLLQFQSADPDLLFHLLPDVGPVYSVSIIPTGAGAAGYTMPLPERDEMFNTRGRMLQEITVDLGGRVAEELIFDDITTGASQDIKQATELAKAMVTKYGMSENIGLINYDNDDNEVFIGRDLAHTRGYGENVASRIDEEVKHIIDECYARAKKIIDENMDVLHRSADLLLEKEKISREEFEALFDEEGTKKED